MAVVCIALGSKKNDLENRGLGFSDVGLLRQEMSKAKRFLRLVELGRMIFARMIALGADRIEVGVPGVGVRACETFWPC